MTNYEFFYGGSQDILEPKYTPVEYSINVSNLSQALDARTANQLGMLNRTLNTGIKHVEIQGVQTENLESIPEQHLTEINRLSKLTGLKPSFHGPLIEASGVSQQGWDESQRESAERQLTSAILRGQKIDPDGNISITLHTTTQLPDLKPKYKTVDSKTGKVVEKEGPFWVINPESGKIQQIPKEKRYFPEVDPKTGKPVYNPGEEQKFREDVELKKINEEIWLSQLSEVNRLASFGESEIKHIFNTMDPERKQEFQKILEHIKKGTNIDNAKGIDKEFYNEILRSVNHGQIYLRESYRNLKGLFDRAYGKVDPNDRKILDKFAYEIKNHVAQGIEKDPSKIQEFSEMIERGVKILGKIESPKTYEPLYDFTLKKSAETYANVAKNAYKKYKDHAPIINLENPPAGGGFSRAEDMKKLIEESRKKLRQGLIKDGVDKTKAKEIAEKMIGATWDVGHINMIRKFGYNNKDLKKEAEIIAPYVKHVHLSDNFGYDHTELPMGMGNVPTEDHLRILKEHGFKGDMVVEAANWFQHFSEQGGGSPFKQTLQNFDAPLSAMYEGPNWAQSGGYGNYYSGYGLINPPIHHNLYGAGLSNLPANLGGEIPGSQSRFSGTPNA